MRNTRNNGTLIERETVELIRKRLPSTWSAELTADSHNTSFLSLKTPAGQKTTAEIVSRKQIAPKDIPYLLSTATQPKKPCILIAQFLSPRSKELLTDLGANYADTCGNIRIQLNKPAVFIETHGLVKDPERKPRPLHSLKGNAASRAVRALCDYIPPYGIRELAELSSTPVGTMSRVVSLLESEALLTRNDEKLIITVDWASLIKRWAQDYRVTTSNVMRSYLEPRGIAALAAKLKKLERYAITGSLAAPKIAPTRLAMIYVDDANTAAQVLDLTPTEAGANIWLLEPYDDVVFERTQSIAFDSSSQKLKVVAASPSQVVVDLMTSPGRGPQEADELIKHMMENEDGWRKQTRT